MNNLSAAVGCAQIENIKRILKAKRANFKWYKQLFNKINYLKILVVEIGQIIYKFIE